MSFLVHPDDSAIGRGVTAGSPNLVEVSLKALPSLNDLIIFECESDLLKNLVEVAPIVTKLDISFISGLTDVVWRGVMEYLGALEELNIRGCNELRYLWESEAAASKVLLKLRKLKVHWCNNLVSLEEKEEGDGSSRSNLLMLDIFGCHNMEQCNCPDNIEIVDVENCRTLTTISLPKGGQKLKSLDIWGCDTLLEREWGGQAMLEYASIRGWPNLNSIIEMNYLVHLPQLKLYSCEGLESLPDNELPNLTSLKHLHIKDCPRMDASFPCGFWPPNLQTLEIGRLKKPISEWDSQNFLTSLVKLTLYGGEDGVSSCSQLSNLLPSSLTSLELEAFEKLESVSVGLQHLASLQHLYFKFCTHMKKLSNLQHLVSLQNLSFESCTNLRDLSTLQHVTSLQHLFFFNCPNMMDLPETLLPSLLSLHFTRCPKLEERCGQSGCYWSLISYIPCINQS